MNISEQIGLFASAHDLRLATIRESTTYAQHVSSAHKQLYSATRAGLCYHSLANSLPFDVHHFQFKDHEVIGTTPTSCKSTLAPWVRGSLPNIQIRM